MQAIPYSGDGIKLLTSTICECAHPLVLTG